MYLTLRNDRSDYEINIQVEKIKELTQNMGPLEKVFIKEIIEDVSNNQYLSKYRALSDVQKQIIHEIVRVIINKDENNSAYLDKIVEPEKMVVRKNFEEFITQKLSFRGGISKVANEARAKYSATSQWRSRVNLLLLLHLREIN